MLFYTVFYYSIVQPFINKLVHQYKTSYAASYINSYWPIAPAGDVTRTHALAEVATPDQQWRIAQRQAMT